MFINQLEIANFRNYKEVKINFESGKILFVGKNAQGKTNLLESIYYLSALDSFRATTDTELIKWGCDFCCIKSFLRGYLLIDSGCSCNYSKSLLMSPANPQSFPQAQLTPYP